MRRCAKDLRALADFLPAFSQAGFSAGELVGDESGEPGVLRMPSASYAPVVSEFVRFAYDKSWVRNFDWSAWHQSEEGQRFWSDEAAVLSATPVQLANLLTVCIRADRFSEGYLFDAFDTGLILRIVERAAVLAEEMQSE